MLVGVRLHVSVLSEIIMDIMEIVRIQTAKAQNLITEKWVRSKTKSFGSLKKWRAQKNANAGPAACSWTYDWVYYKILINHENLENLQI